LVAEGLQAMFLTYGFSAKRTSGYGVANDAIENFKEATCAQTPAPKSTKLSQLPQEVKDVRF
jgi:CRISPR-associated protein Cmr2